MKIKRFVRRFANQLLSRTEESTRTQDHFPQYEIGRDTYGVPEVFSWNEGSTLTIGKFCSIAAGVKIFLGGEHRSDWVTTYPFNVLWDSASSYQGHPHSKGNVTIGNDVWIATDATILSGVEVKDGAVIGARSLVTKDVEPYSIVAGNPARLIRKRFDEATIAALLEARWWDLPDQDIVDSMPLLLSGNAAELIQRVQQLWAKHSPDQG